MIPSYMVEKYDSIIDGASQNILKKSLHLRIGNCTYNK